MLYLYKNKELIMVLRRFKHLGLIAVFFSVQGLLFSQKTISEDSIIIKSRNKVSSVAWSPDGNAFASVWNNSVIVWNAESGKIINIFNDHSKPVKVVRFSRDGRKLLSLGQDNIIIMRDIHNEEEKTVVKGTSSVLMNDALFAGDNSSVILPNSGKTAMLYCPLRVTSQFISQELYKSDSIITSFDLSSDNSRLLVSSKNGKVALVNAKSASTEKIYSRYARSGIAPRFSPDGKSILAATDSQTLTLTQKGAADSVSIKDSDQPLNCAVFSSDGALVAYAVKNGRVKIYNLNSNSIQQSFMLPVSSDQALSLAFSPDGSRMLSGTADGSILCWSLTDKAFATPQSPGDYLNEQNAPEEENIPEETPAEEEKKEAGPEGTPSEEETEESPEQSQSEESAAEEENAETGEASDVAEPEIQDNSKLKNTLELSFLFTRLSEDYYDKSFGLTAAWKNYKRLPFYYGLGGEAGTAPVSDDYPYNFSYNGIELNQPWLYHIHLFCCAGYGKYFEAKKILLFSECRLGFGGNFLFNNEFTYRHSSHLAASVNAALLAGIQWKALTLSAGGAYDTSLGLLFRANAGFVLKN